MLHTTATLLPRLMQCIGSRLMGAEMPPSDTDRSDRDEGDAAHWVATQIFNGHEFPETLVDRKAPNGHYVTKDMLEHVMLYIGGITDPSRGRMIKADVEHDTTFSGNGYTVAGRCDAYAIGVINDHMILYVDDFKYGYGIIEPENNWTLVSHAVGICIAQGLTPTEIVLTVHQPRPHHMAGKSRDWRINYGTLLELYREIDVRLSAPAAVVTSGPECGHCPALAVCPAGQRAAYNAIEVSTRAHDDDISNEVMSIELDLLARAKKAIEARAKALQELATHRLRTGAIIPNYALDRGLGDRTWKKHVTPELLTAVTGRTDIVTSKLISPPQLIQLGVDEATVNLFCERPDLGTRLKRIDLQKRAAALMGKGTK